MSPLYNYIKNQWIMRSFTVGQLSICVSKHYLTQAESDEIMAMPQVEVGTDGA